MKIVSAEEVHAALANPDLIDALQDAFAKDFTMPPRKVFSLDEDETNHDAFALLPSWNESVIGVKAFTYFPSPAEGYQSLYSKILLFDRQHGQPLALVDGTTVTFWRTAGISGLASRLLSREDSSSLLVLGTGNLAPYIIRAQASVRTLQQVRVWGRTREKAEKVVGQLFQVYPQIQFSVADDLATACRESDIVVSATGSHDPLVKGEWIQPGTHTDFIGNHHANKRECDTELVTKAKIYADSRDNCFREAGEILVPIAEGAISAESVVGELTEMCRGQVPLRESDNEITLFKSIGMALSDLVGAMRAYQSVAQAST
jgi:1-pyrroline-2-carboxylate reductase [NAD(P)H]